MLAIERRKLDTGTTAQGKRVVVSELSRKFSVSGGDHPPGSGKFEKDDLVIRATAALS